MNNRNAFFLPYLQVALLLLIVLALYAGSLHAPFVFDDSPFFANYAKLAKYARSYFSFDLRWLPYSSLVWTISWFGLDVFWLRLGNVLLHAANTITLFFLLRRLFQVTLANNDASSSMPSSSAWFAFFGALIFALHPVSVYGVAYLVERSILMATLFVLLMLLAYLEGLLRGGWHWMLAAVLCYFAAVYSKEHSIAAPAVALALTFLVRKPSLALFRQIAPYYILSALIAVTVLLSVKGVLAKSYEPHAASLLELSAKTQALTEMPDVYLMSILTQSFLFFKYLWLWLLPDPAWMSVDMREPFAASYLSWHTLGMIAFLAYPCIAVWLLLKRGSVGLLGFAMLFPWLLFFTEFSTVRIQEPFVLYRSYLWMPGLFAALPIAFGWLAPKKTYILLGVICLSLVPLTLNRLNTFSNPLLLWDDAEKLVRDNPDAYGVERIYTTRGEELALLKRFGEAISDFNKAIDEQPNLDFTYINRAATYYYLGRHREALRDYDHAVSLKSNNPKSYYGRALAYRALGNFAAAQEDLKRSCALGGPCS